MQPRAVAEHQAETWPRVNSLADDQIAHFPHTVLKPPAMSTQRIATPMLPARIAAEDDRSERVFVLAAELFSALATPLRLRILGAICAQGKSVKAIVEAVESTQPNVSQHLRLLYRAGIVAKRRIGNRMVYRVQSEEVLELCHRVCSRIASELDPRDSWDAEKPSAPAKHLGTARAV